MHNVRALLIATLLALAPVSAGAETIRAIEFRGLQALPEETLRFYLGLEEGQELDETALDRSLRELWDRRLIDDIQIEREPLEDGIRLIITVVERPILRSIDYEGLERLNRSEISDRISKDQIDVREGDPLDLGEIRRLEASIEELYKEKGYRFADARWRMETVSPTERRIVFEIDEAEKVRIGAIRFEGNDVFGNTRLRWKMKKTKKTNLVTRMLKKDIYNPASLEEDLGLVRDLYRASGYKNVIIGDPELSVQEGRGKRRLAIQIPIEEGRRWKLGEVSIDGNERFTDEMLLRRFTRPRGGWLRSKLIEESIQGVDELYRNFGHIFANIDYEYREREGGVADVLVHIEEGDQYRVGRLEFEGNTKTRDKVLRREFRVQEGTVLNMGAMKSSLFKINQLGYFKLNEDEPVSFENFDSESKTVDLRVRGEESDRTELQVGGGYSEGYGWFGQLSVRTQNFLGRGETVGVSYQSGRYADQFDVSYFIPWFLDRPQSIGLQLFRNELDYSLLAGQDLVQKSEGAVLTYGRSLGLFGNVSVSLTSSELDEVTTLLDLDGNPVTLDLTLAHRSLRPAYVYESRDDRFEPTIGSRLSASVEYAGGFLGGDNYFVRPEVGMSWFHPVTNSPVKTVFAVNGKAGWIEPFSGRELTRTYRYYLGGETSIRGFRYRSLWVRCEGGEILPTRPDEPCEPDQTLSDAFGLPIGGNKYLQFNVEYHFLLGGPFRILGFVDAANVFGDDQSYDVGRLRWTAGAELRIFVPVFGAPLRFIYSSNLEPLPDDRFESFQFSIGATF